MEDSNSHSVSKGASGTLREARETAERSIVIRVLHKHSGNITATAAELGISRPTLYELIEKLGITKV